MSEHELYDELVQMLTEISYHDGVRILAPEQARHAATAVYANADLLARIVAQFAAEEREGGTFHCWRCGVRHPYATGCPKDKDD